MKIWNTPEVDELKIEETASGVLHGDKEQGSSKSDYCAHLCTSTSC